MKNRDIIKLSGRVRIVTTDSKTRKVKRMTEWFKNLVVAGTNTGRILIAQRLSGVNTYTLNITHADIGRGYTAPGAPTVATGAAGVLNGTYSYKITFVTAAGETEGGTTSSNVSPSSQHVTVSSIPIGASGVTARKIYRTTAGGAQHKLLATINDNSTTSYDDNAGDGSLGANVPTATTAGAITPANSDTQLQTASVRSAVSSQAVNSNVSDLQFFYPDAQLPNGTYSEFGTFVDGAAGLNTGQLFNRALFGTQYVKNSGEDTTVEVSFTIN